MAGCLDLLTRNQPPDRAMHPVDTFELVLLLLSLVLALHWLALKLRFPPSAVLLIGGAALAFMPGLPEVSLDPELALVLFLPPMLIQGAFRAPLARMRRQLPGILSLAIGAVIFTTLIVGLVTRWLVPDLPWAACFALGAIVSPPDAVSAQAVLKGVHLPRRLNTLLEGESLLNDATGLILFRFAVAATLSGTFSASSAIAEFLIVALGGALVGLAVGAAWLLTVRYLRDQMLMICLTSILCWVAYLSGEALHVSGVIATVTAGLLQGWFQHSVLPADVRLQGASTARTFNFLLEALVFILIGFSLSDVIERLGGFGAIPASMIITVIGVIFAVTIARFIWVFGCEAMLATLQRAGVRWANPMGWRQATVLCWAGMRGVVTLAIPLTLPFNMPGRDLMLVCAFGVIFATVIVQGSSLGWLIRKVRPEDREPPAPMGMAAAEAAVERARRDTVQGLAKGAEDSELYTEMLRRFHERQEFFDRYTENSEAEMVKVRARIDVMLKAQAAARAELIRLQRAGQIEDDLMRELERDLDIEEIALILQRGD